MKKLLELYKTWSGAEPQQVEKLAGAGSNREYYRMIAEDGSSVVGCIGTSRDENHAFVYLAKHFTKRQLPVPQVLAVSEDELRYLQTDLGTVSLFDAIRGGREAGGRAILQLDIPRQPHPHAQHQDLLVDDVLRRHELLLGRGRDGGRVLAVRGRQRAGAFRHAQADGEGHGAWDELRGDLSAELVQGHAGSRERERVSV